MTVADYSIPKYWQSKKIEESCSKISLNGIKIKQKDYLLEGKYPVIDQGQELVGGYYNDDNLLVSNDPPYIIFGDHTKVKKFINFKFIAGADGVKVLKPYSFFDPKYFYYSLHTIRIPDKGYARHFQFLEKEFIPIPPLPEQRVIVAKIEQLFSELDNGIANLKTALAQLKIYRQAVLKYAFEGKLTRRNHGSDGLQDDTDSKTQENKISEIHQSVKISDSDNLPEGWKWLRVADISEVSGGLTKNSKRTEFQKVVPFLRVANVGFDSIDLSDLHTIGVKDSEFERVKLLKNDLLFVEGNGSVDQIGRVALWNSQVDNCIHQNHLIKARISNQVLPRFVMHYFCSKNGRDAIIGQAQSTSGLHTLSLSKISNLIIPFPELKEQQQIIELIDSRLSVCDKLEADIQENLSKAEALRQSILKKAFEGRLLSEQELEACRKEPDWEPAEKLLERIQKESNHK